jgi:hypothetical protein
MAVTASVITKNVRMSRRWKAELAAYRIHTQPSPSFTHLLPLKPNRSPVYLESFQHLALNSKPGTYQTVHRNRLYE